ncbi:MAG: response regulator [SAR324 cluster bacterium]|nr:response regulator [SAR324 cluster bacterium]
MKQRTSILIIDDEAIVGTRLKAALEKSGYFVETFTNSSKALELLAKKSFSIIVTDLSMPNIDGMEIFRFVKTHYPKSKTILISGFATVENTRRALQDGVFDYISKPFKISYIKEIIDRAATEIGNEIDIL